MISVIVPVRAENTLNLREHWAARAKRAREHRTAAFFALKAAKAPHALPATITVTRIAPRQLDAHDGLPASLKGVIDGVADYLLIKDNDKRVTWQIAQRRGGVKEYAVEVAFG